MDMWKEQRGCGKEDALSQVLAICSFQQEKTSSGDQAMVFYLQVNAGPAGLISVKLLVAKPTGFRRL